MDDDITEVLSPTPLHPWIIIRSCYMYISGPTDMYVYVHVTPTVCRLILFENVKNFSKVYSRKLRTLNCDSHEPTKVMVSNAAGTCVLMELHKAQRFFN